MADSVENKDKTVFCPIQIVTATTTSLLITTQSSSEGGLIAFRKPRLHALLERMPPVREGLRLESDSMP